MPYVIELTRAAGRRRALERSDRVRLLVAVRRAALRAPDAVDTPEAADVVAADVVVAGAEAAGRPVT